MKIAVLAATGSTGTSVVDKALAADHDVVAVSRSSKTHRATAQGLA